MLQFQGSLCIFGCICFFILLLLNFSEPAKSYPAALPSRNSMAPIPRRPGHRDWMASVVSPKGASHRLGQSWAVNCRWGCSYLPCIMGECPPPWEMGRKVLTPGCAKGQLYVGHACRAWVFPRRRRGSPEPLQGAVCLMSSSMLLASSLVLCMGFGMWELSAISSLCWRFGGKSFVCTLLAGSSPIAQQVAGQWESRMLLSSPTAVECCPIRSWGLLSAVVCQK